MPLLQTSRAGREQTNQLIQRLFQMMLEKQLLGERGEQNLGYLREQRSGSMDLENLRSQNQIEERNRAFEQAGKLQASESGFKEIDTFNQLIKDAAKDGDIASMGAQINWAVAHGQPVDPELKSQYESRINGYVETIFKLGQNRADISPDAARAIATLSQTASPQILSQIGQTARLNAEAPLKLREVGVKEVEAQTKRMTETREGATPKELKSEDWAKSIKADLKALKELLTLGEITPEEYDAARKDRLGIYKAPDAVDPVQQKVMELLGGRTAPTVTRGSTKAPAVAYKYTATNPTTGQRAGSNDGVTWTIIK